MIRILMAALVLMVIESGCKLRPGTTEKPAEVAQPVVIPEPAIRESAPFTAPLRNDGSWVATAASQESTNFIAPLAIDGRPDTRWSSEFQDNQWWQVDFGREHLLANILLKWEDAYARTYRVQLSTNGTDWITVHEELNGNGGADLVTFERQPARYVRIECGRRATPWGASLIEVEFNTPEPVRTEASASSGTGDYAPKYAIDGKPDTRWSSNFNDAEWWQVRFDKPQTLAGLNIAWETAFAEKYEIAVSMDGQEWRTIYQVTEGDGHTDMLFFQPVEAQYLRIVCQQRGTGWGNSIWDVTFYDQDHAPLVTATSARPETPAALALDGRPDTAWQSVADGEQAITFQLPEQRNLGGIELIWGDHYARVYDIECSPDGINWSTVAKERNGNGARDYVFFPATAARYVRINCRESGSGTGYALAHAEFKGGEEQATPLRAYQSKALDARPGMYPRWLRREQEFWTVVGELGDPVESLITESGVYEPAKGDFSVMPFIFTDGRLTGWADVQLEQFLVNSNLPLPSVRWTAADWTLEITPLVYGPPGQTRAAVRYRFVNTASRDFAGKLGLAIRPVQVNPVWQYGGFSAIHKAEFITNTTPAVLRINDRVRVVFATPPAALGAAPLEEGDAVDFLATGTTPASRQAGEKEGKTSAAVLYDLQVPAGGTRDIVVGYPLHDASGIDPAFTLAPDTAFAQKQAELAQRWAETLDGVTIRIPEQRLIDVMKSNLGYVLINRDSPWFKPGSRNYNHSWMRDGALTGVAMLRMGKPELPGEFIRAFNGFVGDDGWVPFIIMEDGRPNTFNTDPNSGEGQEYDSQGQFPFIVRQYYDFTGDAALLRDVYPKVVKALRFAQELRRRRMTDEYRDDPAKRPYFGILPPSNSHEGYYPAKTSYWDDFWVLKGFKDGAYLATVLGQTNDAAWMQAEANDFRQCLYNSMRLVMQTNNMDHLPGCVELGDTDPTSTSVAIMACDEMDYLPQPYGANTFDIFYRDFHRRIDPGDAVTFTPYECRNADVFVRMNQRERALEMLRYFTSQCTRPHNWNHLAEVVHAKPRSPSYIGDMPHTWCGSDYINAVRSIFAYEGGDRLVLAGGVDPAWFKDGIEVKGVPTQFGPVDYTIREAGDAVTIRVSGAAAPAGGFAIPLPESLKSKTATVDGQPAAVTNGAVQFAKLPAEIRIAAAE